jgi:oligopeptide transport system ATP-binding protein
MSKEKILEVNHLSISFRTPNGLVRAVRDVSFDLYKGETLAIVGESGSGKSVTNRAIMGILAGNSIIDDGEILYRNQDLTKLSEENFHLIRGNKIGMIYQDPLSSLNPIMKIGKQITEAMLVNGDRLKNRMHDLYHQEYHEYLNAQTRITLLEKETKNKIYELSVNHEMKKSEKRLLIRNIKAKNIENAKKLTALLPEYKAKYIDAKNRAKIQIRKEADELKAEKKSTLNSLHQQLKEKKSSLSGLAKTDNSYVTLVQEIKDLKDQISNNSEMFTRKFKVTKKEAYEKAIHIMNEVGIPEPEKRFTQYPFQFSGGMRQRIVIAIALTANPELLICDEPTTALDVTIQGQILNLIKDIKAERGLSVIFITHDLGVVANMADRVAVMYAGKIVEYGTLYDIFYDSRHPYTWALLTSVPDLDTKDKLLSIPGTPPDMLFPPIGDAFADRNQYALKIDFLEQPPFFKINDTHYAATWLLHPDAPKIEMPKILRDRIDRFHKQIDADKPKDKVPDKKNDGAVDKGGIN